MKKFKNLFIYTAMLAGVALYSCEGPAGKDGVNGQAGIDGTAVCQECHSSDQAMAVKVAQYNGSFHATSDNAAYANNSSAACTQCHVSQGFIDYIKNGKVENTAKYSDPLQPNCYTCHSKIHTTYTEADWALTTTAPVTMTLGGATFDKGNGNLCANCHQARALNPAMPELTATADVNITSTRWGTHHGPMANVLIGKGLYEVAGTLTYGTNVHGSIADGCITCHMATPYGTMAGGHSLGMEYDSHGTIKKNFNGCTSCHTDAAALNTKVIAFQASTQAKLDELQALLVAQNVYNATTGLIKATGAYTPKRIGAYLNYQTVKEDKSLGIHNPAYTKALLQNSIEALSAK